MSEAIRIEDLVVKFDNFTLDISGLKVPKGIVLGIVGRNGAGKTTLLDAISNTNKDYYGKIYIDNNAIWEDEKKYLKSFGYVPDTLIFNPALNVRKLLEIMKKSFLDFDEQFFLKMVETLELDAKIKIGNLSHGNQKKLNIITIMALKPQVLVLDEPTEGLDPVSKNEILDLIQSYIDDEKTIIFSTHQTNELDRISDYLLFLEQGKVLMFDEKEQIVNDHYKVVMKKEQLTEEVKKSLINYQVNSFDVTGLTIDSDLVKEMHLDYVKPTIEDIMMNYLTKRGVKK
ncbi:MAG: ABC transporter ATP-binding protein [Acholeplasma sp.]|nr:ABC transporter ATP-binding protein [Acholeplasma sp.]